MAPNLGLSPPAVCASAAVRFIFGHSSRGQIAVQGVGVEGAALRLARRGLRLRQVGQKWRRQPGETARRRAGRRGKSLTSSEFGCAVHL